MPPWGRFMEDRLDPEAESNRLRFYNTLTNSVEPFVPMNRHNIKMYVCGPTLYDDIHIGNARPIVVFDLLFKFLCWNYGKDSVIYARNITDIDDKIADKLKIAEMTKSPHPTINDAAQSFIENKISRFRTDLERLNCSTPTYEPKARDNIRNMLSMIGVLIEKKHAYVVEGNVYFDVSSYPNHGMLAGRDPYAHKVKRLADDPLKKNPDDFVLWKKTVNAYEHFSFASDYGYGRPGWHIECSAMSKNCLGDVFDIHGGGQDLIFPHHENEITQSCCANDTPFMAKYWLHNGFVNVNDKKMSKSDGSMIKVRDLLSTYAYGNQSWDGQILRWALLRSHYRHPLNFSVEVLFDAQRSLQELFNRCKDAIYARDSLPKADARFMMALGDDLNTPRAIARLFEIDDMVVLRHSLEHMGFIAGKPLVCIDKYTDMVNRMVFERDEARAVGAWAEADKIRDTLEKQGIKIQDSKTGEKSIWTRMTG